MADDEEQNPEDALRDMLRDLLSGQGQLNPEQLAGVAGLPSDPASIRQLILQLQNAMQGGGEGINWDLAVQQGVQLARAKSLPVTPGASSSLEQAFHVAGLWLDEATSVSELTRTPELLGRADWVRRTMPVWTQLAEPVATSIADALTSALQEQVPEELAGMLSNSGQLLRAVGGTLFSLQLGQVVGALAEEVVSGGDVGIPLLEDGVAALLPQNVAAFGEGLDIEQDQVALYLAVRELAHARLFRHARWLRLQVITSITEFARGIRIDTSAMEELAESFDPSNPETLREALASGAFIPPKSEAQLATLARLETMLALIEGWVDVVTAQATTRLPRAGAIAEMVRRRRASGGPAESAFATLVGLELRPRRLREAAAMWQAVTDAAGADARDALWSHPDLLPTSEDIDDPAALVAKVTGAAPAPEEDALDRAIEELLNDEDPDRPTEV